MTLDRLLIIRHAEQHDEPGFTADGEVDPHSLVVRGWQRAGALASFFGGAAAGLPKPDAIYASAIAPGSESKRPQQTVAPLLALLRTAGAVSYRDTYGKHDIEPLMADVLTRSGTVLLSWEHSKIAECVACLPNPPATPEKWPSDRYDLVWVFEPDGSGWFFRQVPQLLLAGDQLPG